MTDNKNMIEISNFHDLKAVCPEVVLGCVQCRVKTEKFNKQLWKEIENVSNGIHDKITLEHVYDLPKIKSTIDTYRKLGKDPTKYRVSSEALIRRILQGKTLYQINNVVDINNLVSLKSFYSIGSYDLKKLVPPIKFRIGQTGENYKGIGKGTVTIENLPVFSDTVGPFGSPTSDSERAMITMETADLLMVLISFSGKEDMTNALNYAQGLLEKYASADQLETGIIS